jgi:hypothetical protein
MPPRLDYGSDVCKAPSQPPTVYEEAAVRWFKAREELMLREQNAAQAQSALDAARKNEADAWTVLEDEAGRGSPKNTASVVGGFTPARY